MREPAQVFTLLETLYHAFDTIANHSKKTVRQILKRSGFWSHSLLAAKYVGGAAGLDGSLYFVPENGYRVLKVTPPESQPNIVNGKLPEGDIKMELL